MRVRNPRPAHRGPDRSPSPSCVLRLLQHARSGTRRVPVRPGGRLRVALPAMPLPRVPTERPRQQHRRYGPSREPCAQASGTDGGWGWTQSGGTRPGQRGRPHHLLDPSSPGCYNCSQHEYFDHGTGTCTPCSKLRGPPSTHSHQPPAGAASPHTLPASFPAAPSAGLCPGVRSLLGTPATWARAAEAGKATASTLRPSR